MTEAGRPCMLVATLRVVAIKYDFHTSIIKDTGSKHEEKTL